MNLSMANLSIQLLLYAAAWLAVGLSVAEHRKACLRWSLSWLMVSVAAALVLGVSVWNFQGRDTVINVLIMSAFLLLYGGLTSFARTPFRTVYAWVSYGGLMALEAARWAMPEHEPLRVWLFTASFAVPITAIIGLLWRQAPAWFRRRRTTQLLLVFPAALTLLVFVARALLSSFGNQPGEGNYETDSTFSLLSTTAFLVFLGFFNFSLFALVLGAMIQRLDTLSSRDQLTGLHNRRVMLEQLHTEHARFLRGGQPYALVLIDLDHFKHVNDRYGHLVGDEVLRVIAQRLRGAIRNADLLARLGGEEFLALLPNTDLAGACKQAERMRIMVGDEPIRTDRGPITVTLSVGVTLSRLIDVDAVPCLARADAAMYQAKAQGRNCLRVA